MAKRNADIVAIRYDIAKTNEQLEELQKAIQNMQSNTKNTTLGLEVTKCTFFDGHAAKWIKEQHIFIRLFVIALIGFGICKFAHCTAYQITCYLKCSEYPQQINPVCTWCHYIIAGVSQKQYELLTIIGRNLHILLMMLLTHIASIV